MKRSLFRFATCCLALTLLATVAEAKDNFARDNELVRGAFTEIVAPASRSTAIVYSGGKAVSVGTIVDKNGYVLTKASELKDKLECELREGAGGRIKAKIVGVAERDDLALLKIETKEMLKPIQWAKDVPVVGSWLATVGVEDRPMAVGVVSVPTRTPRTNRAWCLESRFSGSYGKRRRDRRSHNRSY